MKEKFCNNCRKKQPLEAYNKRAASYDGHSPICKSCEKQRCQEQYQKRKKLASKTQPDKQCVVCEQIKPASEFRKGTNYCVECRAEVVKIPTHNPSSEI